MRNIIQYFYNIDINNIKEYDSYYIIDDYILKEVKYNIDMELYNYLITNNIYVDKIIPNIKDEYITIINNKKYILSLYNKEKVYIDDIYNYDHIIFDKNNIDWSKLWENKVDYYEQNIININNKDILSIYPYYIGLSEIAIRVYKEIGNNKTKSISHNRLNNELEFYNITNLKVDYKVRDIAEYIKKEFFNDNKMDITFIFNLNLTNDDYLTLYSRLLFPTYFFDCVEVGDNISKYISKINLYEDYLNYIYYELSKVVKLPYIDWLIKKV